VAFGSGVIRADEQNRTALMHIKWHSGMIRSLCVPKLQSTPMANNRPRVSGQMLTPIELDCSIRSNQKRAAYLVEFLAQLNELNRVREKVKLAALSAENAGPPPNSTLQ
jgi:hypothetical protein